MVLRICHNSRENYFYQSNHHLINPIIQQFQLCIVSIFRSDQLKLPIDSSPDSHPIIALLSIFQLCIVSIFWSDQLKLPITSSPDHRPIIILSSIFQLSIVSIFWCDQSKLIAHRDALLRLQSKNIRFWWFYGISEAFRTRLHSVYRPVVPWQWGYKNCPRRDQLSIRESPINYLTWGSGTSNNKRTPSKRTNLST